MVETATPKVVNCHHFGGSDKLPSNTIYIGRPGPWGNPYSSKSGLYPREECVAQHRVDLYHHLITTSTAFDSLKHELYGHDLACWCVQPKQVVSCHGDNYLHILSEPRLQRDYKNGVVPYLMEDVRFVLDALSARVNKDSPSSDFLFLYIHFEDVRITLVDVLRLCREKYVNPDDLCVFIATVLIDLELALRDPDLDMVHYRFDHAYWVIHRFIAQSTDRDHEPTSPRLNLKRKSKG